MNSREIVARTLDFDNPERVARSFHDSDMMWKKHNCKTRATDWRRTRDDEWEMLDEWGNTWHRIDETSKGEVAKGVLADWSDLDSYEFPDFSNGDDYNNVRTARAENPDKWLICGLGGFAFSIARKMRKFETYLMDLMLEPERVAELHDRIDEVLKVLIRNYADAGADSVMLAEDWGTQTQLLVNPTLFRKEFLPRYAKLCDVAHECGIKVFLHSCGQIESIVPDLIDAGVDLFQFDQPELHGLDVLAGHQERAKITYWCPVDIQTVLQTGDEQLIRSKAREMLDKLWKGRGGFIAGYYGNNASIGLDPKSQEFACDEFLKRGVSR